MWGARWSVCNQTCIDTPLIMTADQGLLFFLMTNGISERNKNVFCRRVGKPLISPVKVLFHGASIRGYQVQRKETGGETSYLVSTILQVRWSQIQLCCIEYSLALNQSGDLVSVHGNQRVILTDANP